VTYLRLAPQAPAITVVCYPGQYPGTYRNECCKYWSLENNMVKLFLALMVDQKGNKSDYQTYNR